MCHEERNIGCLSFAQYERYECDKIQCRCLLLCHHFSSRMSVREHCVLLLVTVRTFIVGIDQGVRLDEKCKNSSDMLVFSHPRHRILLHLLLENQCNIRDFSETESSCEIIPIAHHCLDQIQIWVFLGGTYSNGSVGHEVSVLVWLYNLW